MGQFRLDFLLVLPECSTYRLLRLATEQIANFLRKLHSQIRQLRNKLVETFYFAVSMRTKRFNLKLRTDVWEFCSFQSSTER